MCKLALTQPARTYPVTQLVLEEAVRQSFPAGDVQQHILTAQCRVSVFLYYQMWQTGTLRSDPKSELYRTLVRPEVRVLWDQKSRSRPTAVSNISSGPFYHVNHGNGDVQYIWLHQHLVKFQYATRIVKVKIWVLIGMLAPNPGDWKNHFEPIDLNLENGQLFFVIQIYTHVTSLQPLPQGRHQHYIAKIDRGGGQDVYLYNVFVRG